MQTDAMFRMYSMTKVLTSFVALRLYEDGLLAFDDVVSGYIPSFDRAWNIAVDSEDGPDRIEYCSFLSGKTSLHLPLSLGTSARTDTHQTSDERDLWYRV